MTGRSSGRIRLTCHEHGCCETGSIWFDCALERHEGRKIAAIWMCDQHQSIVRSHDEELAERITEAQT